MVSIRFSFLVSKTSTMPGSPIATSTALQVKIEPMWPRRRNCNGARNSSGITRSQYDDLRGVSNVYVKDPSGGVKYGPTGSARYPNAGDHPALLHLHKRACERVWDIRSADISDQE